MKLNHILSVLCTLSVCASIMAQPSTDGFKEFQVEKIESNQLAQWDKLGKGDMFKMEEQVCLKEADDSKGIMLVSPKTYDKNLVIKFKVLALTSPSVVAVIISGSDSGNSNKLSIPTDYDGNFSLWQNDKENYFFAFKNAPHDKTPFVAKNTNSMPGKVLAAASSNHMTSGLYYDIEIGCVENKLWLSINQEKMFEITDEEKSLSGGHIALRIRGTAGFKGAGLFKDLTIYSRP